MDLEQFEQRRAQLHTSIDALAEWHRNAHLLGDLPLVAPDETYVYATEYDDKYDVDVEATKAHLGKVVRYATKQKNQKVKIEKKYDHNFELTIELVGFVDKYGGPLKIRYVSQRDVVCEKKVVGSRYVPEKVIPAREEEIVEWECSDVSLLSA